MPERLGRLVLPELTLDSGKTLALELAYSVNGDPAPDGSNVVLQVHGPREATICGPDVPGLPGPGGTPWWAGKGPGHGPATAWWPSTTCAPLRKHRPLHPRPCHGMPPL